MIDEKKIEEAANAYTEKVSNGKHYRDLTVGFEVGAHWAIKELLKGLWHDAKEKPKSETLILADIELTRSHNHVYESFYFYKNWKLGDIEDKYLADVKVVRWLYIDNLLKQKGDEKCDNQIM